MRILSELKKKYNKWLFNKYGFNRGDTFQKIPIIFLIKPLFSPSLYSYYEAQEIIKALDKGLGKLILKEIVSENLIANEELDILEKGIGIRK